MLINNTPNKRTIIVGPTASGKTFLRNKFEERGFVFGISYTTREKRAGEISGVHYHFVSKEYFEEGIQLNWFYEYSEYNGNYYGTGIDEWDHLQFFIMETEGVQSIKPEDRNSCFIIYLNPDKTIRESRMALRGWDLKKINERIETDKEKFYNFDNYDLLITNSNF